MIYDLDFWHWNLNGFHWIDWTLKNGLSHSVSHLFFGKIHIQHLLGRSYMYIYICVCVHTHLGIDDIELNDKLSSLKDLYSMGKYIYIFRGNTQQTNYHSSLWQVL